MRKRSTRGRERVRCRKGRRGGIGNKLQVGEDEKEKKEEERLNIHIWWCGGFHGMVHGYGDTRLLYKDSYKVVGAQGCQGRCGGCTAHGTYWGKHRATQ